MSQEGINEDSFSSDEEFDEEDDETDSSSDIDMKIANEEVFDEEFFKCYSALKEKDEKIYDKSVTFFSDKAPSSSDQPDNEKVYEPKVTLLSHQLNLKESELEDGAEQRQNVVQKSYYEKELDEIKNTISKEIDSDSDDELLVVKGSGLGGPRPLSDERKSDRSAINPLANFWADPSKISEEDKFLRDYILNKRYIPTTSNFFSENLDQLSDIEDDVEPQVKERVVERHSDQKDFDKIKRIPRNSTKTIRDIVEKRKKKEKRIERLSRKKKRKQSIKNADCEDLVGDLPTKFPYVETEPVDYGLTAEQLLFASDDELDKAAPRKSKKHKRPAMGSKDSVPEAEPTTSTSNSNKRKKKHKRGVNHKKFAKVGVAPDRLLSYGLSKTKLRKSKLL